MATRMRGQPLAEELRAGVRRDVERLHEEGVTPTLGTVLMTADDAATSFMDRKHEACRAFGIETTRVDVDPTASAATLYRAVDRLADDDEVTALFVQVPLPAHVDESAVRERVPPGKDVDCFAPANLGRLVAGEPVVTPATAAAVLRLLDAYDVALAGREAVVVGRTTAIGMPIAQLLLARDATVTVCHTSTADLASHTRRADVLVTAAGAPELVDASMVSSGVSVVDVSVTRVDVPDGRSAGKRTKSDRGDTESGYDLVGDVAFDSVREKADAITPVPGGVGPLTLAHLLRNVVDVTARGAGVDGRSDDGGDDGDDTSGRG